MTQTLRILFMMDHCHTPSAGTEQHLLWLFNNLDPERFEKYFLVFSRLDCPADEFPVRPLVLGQVYGNRKSSLFRRFRALIRYLCNNRIDIIHAFTHFDEVLACYAAMFVRWMSGQRIPVVGHRRNIGYATDARCRMMRRLTRWFNIAYIANSRAAVDAAWEKEGIPSERFTVMNNPFSRSRWEAGLKLPISRSELGFDAGDFVIGSVATIRRIKGYETLVQAARLVVDKHPNTHFLCIGGVDDASYLDELRTLTAELSLERHLFWHGGIDNPFRVLPVFDLAVLSSYSESFSNSVLEYAASGLPVVASDVGGMSEIITDDENGFLVPAKQPERLAEKIITLIEKPELRRTFSERIAEAARRNFNESVILSRYTEFYERLGGK